MSITTSRRDSRTRPIRPPLPDASRRTPRADGIWHLVATAVIWSTTLFVAALWVHGGGIADLFSGWPGVTSSIGRLLGLVAANLLLLQVLLMARVPLFERGLGRDAITRLHRFTGFWSFWLMLGHILLITIGYAAGAGVDVTGQFLDFVLNYPAMMLATVGTALIVGVVALSICLARRAMRYESWHLLHLYAYLGVGLALPHQLWTGSDFLNSPAATAYWWTLWALAAVAIVVYRILTPLIRSMRAGMTVEAVLPAGASGVTVRLRGRADRLRAAGGQFFVFRFLDGPGWTRGHPFSISAAPDGRHLEVTARIVGDGTERMTRLEPGTRVLLEGPYGQMTGARRRGSKLLMLAAGAGISPLVSLLEEQHYGEGDAVLLVRDSRPEQALLVSRIHALVRNRGVRYQALAGPRTRASSPWLPKRLESWTGRQLLRYLMPDLDEWDVYLCGPVPWMRAVLSDLDAVGVRRDHVHSEAFAI